MNKDVSKPYVERYNCAWSQDSIRYINTPTPIARQSFFYVQEAGYFYTLPPYFTERANLSSFLIIYTLSGRGILNYMGKEYSAKPQTALFINCMEYHEYHCESHNNWEFLWVHFYGSTANGYYKEFLNNGFHPVMISDSHTMEQNLRNILKLTQQKTIHSEIMISSMLLQAIAQLFIFDTNANDNNFHIPSHINTAVNVIETHYQEPLSLDDLAAQACISKYYLSREFKRYTGTSPNEYLILTRLNHAKELLKDSEYSVDKIAFLCGFNHVSHFINIFKKHEKTTPLHFRKKWSE